MAKKIDLSKLVTAEMKKATLEEAKAEASASADRAALMDALLTQHADTIIKTAGAPAALKAAAARLKARTAA